MPDRFHCLVWTVVFTVPKMLLFLCVYVLYYHKLRCPNVAFQFNIMNCAIVCCAIVCCAIVCCVDILLSVCAAYDSGLHHCKALGREGRGPVCFSSEGEAGGGGAAGGQESFRKGDGERGETGQWEGKGRVGRHGTATALLARHGCSARHRVPSRSGRVPGLPLLLVPGTYSCSHFSHLPAQVPSLFVACLSACFACICSYPFAGKLVFSCSLLLLLLSMFAATHARVWPLNSPSQSRPQSGDHLGVFSLPGMSKTLCNGCAVLHCSMLCCVVLCCVVLCCVVVCSALEDHILLHTVVMYITLCDVLCCAVLCCAVLCCDMIWCFVVESSSSRILLATDLHRWCSRQGNPHALSRRNCAAGTTAEMTPTLIHVFLHTCRWLFIMTKLHLNDSYMTHALLSVYPGG